MTTHPAIFLDRDGTMNVDVGYLNRLDQLELYPWTTDALRLLKHAGYRLVVITNQSGIAQGLIAPEFVAEAHAAIQRRLHAAGAEVDAFYFCPHHPGGSVKPFAVECRCRKPAPGMAEQAIADLQIDPARSWVIGDKWIDVQLAHAVGAKGILVRTGWGAHQEGRPPAGVSAEAVCDNLIHAVSVILRS